MDEYKNPTDTFFGLSVPVEQEAEDDKTKADVFSEAPVIQAIIDRFTERIAFYASVDSIESFTDADEFMHVTAANKLAVELLRQEKEALELLIDQYK